MEVDYNSFKVNLSKYGNRNPERLINLLTDRKFTESKFLFQSVLFSSGTLTYYAMLSLYS